MIYSLFYRHNFSCTVFWVSSYHLSVNIVVLYQFTVPGQVSKTSRLKLKREVSRTEKRFKIAIFGLSIANPSTSPLKALFDSSQLSSSINVQDGGTTSFLKTIHGSRPKIHLLCRLGRRRCSREESPEWICESRCRQVVFVYMYLRDFLALKPFHNYSLCSVCILPQPAFYS